jgi:hypothetical protein
MVVTSVVDDRNIGNEEVGNQKEGKWRALAWMRWKVIDGTHRVKIEEA